MVKKYSEEFRHDALKLASEIGVRQASEKLDISTKTLYHWQRVDRLEHGSPSKGCTREKARKKGMKRLKQENAGLWEADLILQKAMGFMADR